MKLSQPGKSAKLFEPPGDSTWDRIIRSLEKLQPVNGRSTFGAMSRKHVYRDRGSRIDNDDKEEHTTLKSHHCPSLCLKDWRGTTF